MRSFTLLLGLLLVGGLTVPAQAQEEKTLFFDETLDEDGTLIIDTHKGSITVTTWDREEVEAEVRIVADDNHEALLEGTDVIVHHSGRTLRFETDYDVDAWKELRRRGLFGVFKEGFSSPSVHYEIRMPRTARLTIDDHKSEIYVRGLAADLSIDTYKGIVEVDDLDGAFYLETHKGIADVEMRDVSDDIDIDTYKGTVTLDLPRAASFDLYADLSRKGDLDSDFDLYDDRRRRDRDGDGYWDSDDDDDDGDHVYRAEVNGGGPRIRMETYKGRLNLRAH